MNVSFSGNQNIQPRTQRKMSAAVKGALFTSTVLGTSTAMSWVKQPSEMQKIVSKCGGKGKYALQYTAFLALYSGIGALTNVALNKIGDAVKLVPGAKFAAGGNIPTNLFNTKLYVRDIKDGRYAIARRATGRIAGSVHPSSIRAYSEIVSLIDEEPFENYYISVNENSLDVKSKPTNNSKTLKTIYADDLYTVVGEKNGWGHLKIGGWIPLDKIKKITTI
jgi:hypothetical protein